MLGAKLQFKSQPLPCHNNFPAKPCGVGHSSSSPSARGWVALLCSFQPIRSLFQVGRDPGVLQFSGTGMVTTLKYGVSHGTPEDLDLVQVC